MTKIPGDFVPLDVRYRRDRAIRSAGIAAELLYIRSLAHARGNDTGGVIEDYDLPDLTAGMADGHSAVAALVRVGLWVQDSPESWRIRSYEKWNPPSDRSADGKLGNHKRWHRDRGIVAPDCAYCVPYQPPPPEDDHPDSPPMIALPIAPDSPPISPPNRRLDKKRVEESRGAIPEESPPPAPKPKKGTRIPDGWTPPEDTRQKMAERFPLLDLDVETEKFTNHWQAESGAKATKTDWVATWRNWIIKANDYAPRHLRPVADPPPSGRAVIGEPPEEALRREGIIP